MLQTGQRLALALEQTPIQIREHRAMQQLDRHTLGESAAFGQKDGGHATLPHRPDQREVADAASFRSRPVKLGIQRCEALLRMHSERIERALLGTQQPVDALSQGRVRTVLVQPGRAFVLGQLDGSVKQLPQIEGRIAHVDDSAVSHSSRIIAPATGP